MVQSHRGTFILSPQPSSLTKKNSTSSPLSGTDYNPNVAILETVHSVFLPWHSQVCSNSLFTEINKIHGPLPLPLPSHRLHPPLPSAPSTRLLLDICFDLNCQDLPPGVEDTHEEFFAPSTGWFHQFLAWDPPELRIDASFSPLSY